MLAYISIFIFTLHQIFTDMEAVIVKCGWSFVVCELQYISRN